MSNKTTLQEAKDMIVYCLDAKGEIYPTSLFDHVMESADEVTSPRGIETKIFIEEFEEATGDGEYTTRYGLYNWLGGQKKTLIELFDTQEEADNEWFRRIMDYDFMRDDQRDTRYYSSIEEATPDSLEMKKELADNAE